MFRRISDLLHQSLTVIYPYASSEREKSSIIPFSELHFAVTNANEKDNNSMFLIAYLSCSAKRVVKDPTVQLYV